MITTILFDLDGVLLDAKEIHYESLNKALIENKFNPIDRESHLSEFDGLPTRIKLDRLLKKNLIQNNSINSIKFAKQKFTIELIKEKIVPVPEQHLLISRLYSGGYKLGVCSNSVYETVKVGIECLRLNHWFNILLSNEDVLFSKPNPEIYLRAMSELNSKADETLILEDNENGIAAAIASGAYVLKVGSINDVNIDNVKKRIREINGFDIEI